MYRLSPLSICCTAAIVLSARCLTLAAQSETGSNSKNIVIEHPTALPAQASESGIAFQLFTESGDGSAYLYIEQRSGRQLSILNVTDPAHVTVVRTVSLNVSGPFDFAQPLKESAILLRFRNSSDEAVLDLRKPKDPTLVPLSGSPYAGAITPLGDSAILMPDAPLIETHASPSDYEIIDASSPAHPVLLYTAKQIEAATTRTATGTTFLLGADGLTIIRQPRVELEYKLEQSSVS